ncbi:restriction endonuclease subunit S [Deinococcus sp. UR1]|uniref:restriction endonuclease subunit S n=1 Tax=Deinococcus sp. UR1 TaxID=1704277 RepID=UPI000A8839A6|nr:restriction endonuclease subunit S [Deinococcus sp. UR1]PIG96817.1 type I restriction endonuclease subunit S [Deinococcus sp. UR1]
MTTSVEADRNIPQRGGTPWGKPFPAHWGAVPLFSELRERQIKNKGNVEGNVLSLSYGRIVRRDVESNHGLLPDSFETYQIVEPGNIVLRLTDLQNDQRSLRVALAGERGIITSAYLCLEGYNGIEHRYSFYLLHSYDLNKVFYSLGGGVRQSLKFDELRWLTLPLPPLSEQQAIVAFLDRETAHLDGLIERKNRLLELLEEQRRAVISQAVTRGLNPDAPLKDSGVPWLGQVPQHWEVRPLKFEAQMESGHTPSRTVEEYWVNCDIPWVSLFDTAHLKQHKVIYETKNMISQLGMNNSSARLLPAGSVVLSRDATVGRVGIMGIAMATSQHFVAWVCGKRLFNEYLYWTLTGPMQEHFQSLTNGATISTIGMPEIRQFAIPLPPLAEQEAISEHLDMQTGKLDVLRQKLEQSIAHLREYRAALITSAVTGQIDVREEATQS